MHAALISLVLMSGACGDNPPEVIDAGQVVILVGIAPVKPAEFVIFRIGQSASGVQTETL